MGIRKVILLTSHKNVLSYSLFFWTTMPTKALDSKYAVGRVVKTFFHVVRNLVQVHSRIPNRGIVLCHVLTYDLTPVLLLSCLYVILNCGANIFLVLTHHIFYNNTDIRFRKKSHYDQVFFLLFLFLVVVVIQFIIEDSTSSYITITLFFWYLVH